MFVSFKHVHLFVFSFQNEESAKRYCAYIQESNLFNKCFSIVPFQRYTQQCMRDMCASSIFSPKGMCITLEAYAKECADNGIFIDWRANTTLDNICGIYSNLSLHY